MDSRTRPSELARVPPRQDHTATVIFIHGLGQSNVSWKMVVSEALAPRFPSVEWILPQACKHPVTFSQGQLRPSWFDIAQLPPHPDEFDERGISHSIALIEDLILAQVHHGIDSKRIFLVGFSQGAALSLMVALTTLHELGGVISMSGWIPPRARSQMIHTPPTFPILWCHGTADTEIPISYAEDALFFLNSTTSMSPPMLQFKLYPGLQHTISDAELDDVSTWLEDVLQKSS